MGEEARRQYVSSGEYEEVLQLIGCEELTCLHPRSLGLLDILLQHVWSEVRHDEVLNAIGADGADYRVAKGLRLAPRPIYATAE